VNRREFARGVLSLAGGLNVGIGAGQQSQKEGWPSKVAGVRLVDSPVANAATQLSRAVSPPYLFNHAMRTFLFGSLIGRALGLRFDEEVLYLGCILHDLGLTERFQGDLPFEIQGAEAARQFLEQQGFSSGKTGIVWDGIAMHASMIGHFKQAEVRLVGEGAGADVIGPEATQIGKTQVDDILRAFPRLRFKDSFLKTCADVVRKHPGGASHSFMRDIGERYVAGFRPRNFCDYVMSAPFAE
jgi:HD domain